MASAEETHALDMVELGPPKPKAMAMWLAMEFGMPRIMLSAGIFFQLLVKKL